MANMGKLLIVTGIICIVAGLIIYLTGDKTGWFGHLPGDIRIEKGNTRFYFPVTTMILLSILLSVILWIIMKFF